MKFIKLTLDEHDIPFEHIKICKLDDDSIIIDIYSHPTIQHICEEEILSEEMNIMMITEDKHVIKGKIGTNLSGGDSMFLSGPEEDLTGTEILPVISRENWELTLSKDSEHAVKGIELHQELPSSDELIDLEGIIKLILKKDIIKDEYNKELLMNLENLSNPFKKYIKGDLVYLLERITEKIENE